MGVSPRPVGTIASFVLLGETCFSQGGAPSTLLHSLSSSLTFRENSDLKTNDFVMESCGPCLNFLRGLLAYKLQKVGDHVWFAFWYVPRTLQSAWSVESSQYIVVD